MAEERGQLSPHYQLILLSPAAHHPGYLQTLALIMHRTP